MGNGRLYQESGGFTEYLYRQVGCTITASNGVQGKIVTEYRDNEKYHSSLPQYSNTSEAYFKNDDITHEVEQARIYKNRRASLDLDWGHQHKEFPKGVVHVHEWRQDKKGNWTRTEKVRYMNNNEISRYGELLRKANENVRFRP